MTHATVTIQLEPTPGLKTALAARSPRNASEAHDVMDSEFERRCEEARAKLAKEMKGWRLTKPDLAMFVQFRAGEYRLGYQQSFEK